MKPRALLLTLLLALQTGFVELAQGQEPSGESTQKNAVRLGHQALQHFSAGDFLEARDEFEEAEGLAHSPVFLLYQARSERELGHFLKARELLTRCAEEPVHESTPTAWQNAVADAKQEILRLTLAIPSVRFLVDGDASYPLTIRSSSQEVSVSREVSVARESALVQELDPGEHQVWVLDARGTSIRTQVVLSVGQKERVVVLSFPRIRPLLLRKSQVGVPLDDLKEIDTRQATRLGGYTALVLGGSAFLFSAAAGSVALEKARAVKRHCIDSRCRPEDQDLGASAVRWANLATAGAVVGATGLAAGVGLLLLPARGGAGVGVSRRF